MSLYPEPKAFREARENLSESLFWAARQIENLNDALNDIDPVVWEKLSLEEKYEELGYPLGKSRRGIKKWAKRQRDVLDAEFLD